MNKCKDCKYFGEEVREICDDGDDVTLNGTGFHTCDRIKHFKSTCYNQYPDDNSIVEDGSGYFAALRVRGSFGCVNWEGGE